MALFRDTARIMGRAHLAISRRQMVWALCAAVGFLSLSPTVMAKDEESAGNAQVILDAFNRQYGDGFKTDRLFAYVDQLFTTIDSDGEGLDELKIARFESLFKAEARAEVASRYLRFDLNGDLHLTREEAEQAFLLKNARRISSNHLDRIKAKIRRDVDNLFKDDPNKDGVIDPAEFGALASVPNPKRRGQQRNHAIVARALLSLDPDHDGKVPQAEAMVLIGNAFKNVPVLKPQKTVGRQVSAVGCQFPKPGEGAEIVLVGAYEGATPTSITVAGQDRETALSALHIEEGSKPLYVVLSSYSPIIWQFEGATNRVAQVVVTSHSLQGERLAIGVMGIDRKKVAFSHSNRCLPPFHELDDKRSEQARGMLEVLTGAKPDHVLGGYRVARLSVPSGEKIQTQAEKEQEAKMRSQGPTIIDSKGSFVVVTDAQGRKSLKALGDHAAGGNKALTALEREVKRFNPRGFIKLDKADVVSEAPIEDYEVLPQQLGLLQLVKEGALEPLSGDKFRILKKMRFPSGLYGAHRAIFLLKEGVPEPTGEPGHSCLKSEKDGQSINGHCM